MDVSDASSITKDSSPSTPIALNLINILLFHLQSKFFYVPCNHYFQTQASLILAISDTNKTDNLTSFVGAEANFVNVCARTDHR